MTLVAFGKRVVRVMRAVVADLVNGCRVQRLAVAFNQLRVFDDSGMGLGDLLEHLPNVRELFFQELNHFFSLPAVLPANLVPTSALTRGRRWTDELSRVSTKLTAGRQILTMTPAAGAPVAAAIAAA